MSTAIAILGGVGLFLLGMTVMTDGLKWFTRVVERLLPSGRRRSSARSIRAPSPVR